MKDSIILEGKTYISARRAAKLMNYAQDYIGQLCRAGKLDSKMVGRSWFVTEDSLIAHRENAIDGTQDRVAKIVKASEEVKIAKEAVKEIIQTAVKENVEVKSNLPVSAPILSPIQSTQQPSQFKYETEKASFLPELRKKVPAKFSLPKNILELAPAPTVKRQVSVRTATRSAAPTATLALSHASTVNPVIATVVVVLIAVTGFAFTLSLTHVGRTLSYGQEASVSSAASELVSEIFKALGLKRNAAPLATLDRDARNNAIGAETGTTTLNGIGIFPSRSQEEDEIAKAKIMNSFSDEVLIKRDQGGTSGVITPVFKKTDGNDFVYVLVPVDEKKQ